MLDPRLAGHCPGASSFAPHAASAIWVSARSRRQRLHQKYKLGTAFSPWLRGSVPGRGLVAASRCPQCHLPPVPAQVVPEDAAVLPLPAVVPRSLYPVPQRPHDVRRPVRPFWALLRWLPRGDSWTHPSCVSLIHLAPTWIRWPCPTEPCCSWPCCHRWHPGHSPT